MIKIFTAHSHMASYVRELEENVNEAIKEGYEVIHTSTVAGTNFSKYTSNPTITIILKQAQ